MVVANATATNATITHAIFRIFYPLLSVCVLLQRFAEG
jgi:hypothetical protein